ncbi:MAG TPA: NADH-quinone oxidoreductase subunit H [Nitrososphaera sp.]|jgi:formate hydrogenlyase subunit 4
MESGTQVADVLVGIFQGLFIIALAPLIIGISRKVKARSQKRVGASVIQPYYDLAKLLTVKGEVVPEGSSWIFAYAPWINFICVSTAAFLIPVFLSYSPFGYAGDIFVLIGLFGLGKFFLILAAIDTGSTLGGIGGSREIMISAILEPFLFMAVFLASLTHGGTNISTIISEAVVASTLSPIVLFAVIALVIMIIIETGRLPFDNPATNLELTMVHKAMIFEYSGKGLGLLEWAAYVKQLILFAIVINLLSPWGIAVSADIASVSVGIAAFIGKALLFAVLVTLLEVSVAKWRLFRIPDMIAMAVASLMIGMVLFYI